MILEKEMSFNFEEFDQEKVTYFDNNSGIKNKTLRYLFITPIGFLEVNSEFIMKTIVLGGRVSRESDFIYLFTA